ncbi:MAG: GyrI-like domain-containing protein [Methanomassiliicoccales archaeon]|nr:GyrI-like domain-containing protein [Methanomassiliicoccales archaeon]
MEKLDLRDKYRKLYLAKAEPSLVEVPEVSMLIISGEGGPSDKEFQAAIATLYQLTYALKFQAKTKGNDFSVMPLEGDFYWQEDVLNHIEWTLMIMQPDLVGPRELQEATIMVRKKKGDNPLLARVRLEKRRYESCAQLLHVGPYDQERGSIEKLMSYLADKGLRTSGLHHEIYLSDPNRVEPQKLKTIIRYPVRKISS